MPALKQVTAALEQIGAKSDVPNHRLLNRGDRSHSSGEEYPEVDELGATAFKVRVDKVQEPNAQGIMEEVEQEVELYVRPPYTRRNKAVWMGTAERPIPIPLLSLLYRRVANTENRFLNQMSTTLKAKLHMFPAMTRERTAIVHARIRGGSCPTPPNDGDLACTARQGLGACTVACEVRRLDDVNVTPEAISTS
eukprot:tig00021096_g18120.t1